MRDQLLAERLESLLTDGVSVSEKDAEREFRRRTEQVKAEYVLVPADKFKAEVAVTDDEVKAAFDARREEFRVPEKRVGVVPPGGHARPCARARRSRTPRSTPTTPTGASSSPSRKRRAAATSWSR